MKVFLTFKTSFAEFNERGLKLGFEASTPEAATQMANDKADLDSELGITIGEDVWDPNGFRKLHAAADAKRMLLALLEKAADDSPLATRAKLAGFERIPDSNKFEIDIILVYPADTSAADMDSDSDAAIEKAITALKETVEADATYKDLVDTSSITVTKIVKQAFVAAAFLDNERDAILNITTSSSLTSRFQQVLEKAIRTPSSSNNKVVELREKIYDYVPVVSEGLSFFNLWNMTASLGIMEFNRIGDNFLIIIRASLPVSLTRAQQDDFAFAFINKIDEEMEKDTRRILLSNVFKSFSPAALCEDTAVASYDAEDCVFFGATYNSLTPVSASFDGSSDEGRDDASDESSADAKVLGPAIAIPVFVFLVTVAGVLYFIIKRKNVGAHYREAM